MVLCLMHYAGDTCEGMLKQQSNMARALGIEDKYAPGREIFLYTSIYAGHPQLGASNGAHTGMDSYTHSSLI